MAVRTSIEIGTVVSDPVKHAVVIGDALYCDGIASALTTSGLTARVDRMALTDRMQDRAFENADLFVIFADGDTAGGDAVIRRLLRRNRNTRIALITDAPWEDRLDYISDRRVGACLSTSIARDQLVAALRLAIDGFSII
jgi:hypothetical protein